MHAVPGAFVFFAVIFIASIPGVLMPRWWRIRARKVARLEMKRNVQWM